MPMKIASSGSADLLTRTGRAFFLLAFGYSNAVEGFKEHLG